MTFERSMNEVRPLAARWWALVTRGLAAIAFGVLALRAPGTGLAALVIMWGVYAVIDGVLTLALAFEGARVLRGWGWLVFEGLVGIAAGVLTFVWPAITAMVLLVMIAVWAVVTGIAEVATAIRLRRTLKNEWLLAASGVCSIAFGVLALMRPGTGALAIVWLIAGYAIAFGALLVALGVRLRRWEKIADEPVSTHRVASHA